MLGSPKGQLRDLTDDSDLGRESRIDQAAGTGKEKRGGAKSWAADKVDDAKDRANRS